ncbi:hypothetical protein FA13DRAFT_1776344 [Coprinellus micaceus]|uniref:Uncharacterized protein n=1 Tax=Coprinellus micaceus TaxID=71717 RepID=A0A4Y7T162_COPMI|nr:hypothetical protein FA13DRAFT_1776344 [Coprinellus micaceus]
MERGSDSPSRRGGKTPTSRPPIVLSVRVQYRLLPSPSPRNVQNRSRSGRIRVYTPGRLQPIPFNPLGIHAHPSPGPTSSPLGGLEDSPTVLAQSRRLERISHGMPLDDTGSVVGAANATFRVRSASRIRSYSQFDSNTINFSAAKREGGADPFPTERSVDCGWHRGARRRAQVLVVANGEELL